MSAKYANKAKHCCSLLFDSGQISRKSIIKTYDLEIVENKKAVFNINNYYVNLLCINSCSEIIINIPKILTYIFCFFEFI